MQTLQTTKNTIQSHGSSYSNYIYTFNIDQQNDGSDLLQLLPYQTETNRAFQDYLDGQKYILLKFKNALTLEENYITIMNVCVISLAQRNFDELEQQIDKAIFHHIILLAEMHIIIHDYDNAIKQLIELFIKNEQQDVVQALLIEVFKHKLYSSERLSNFVQDGRIIEQLIKINKQYFIQSYSQNTFQTKISQISNLSKKQSYQQDMFRQSSFNEINKTMSDQTQQTGQTQQTQQTQQTSQTDQLSLISQIEENEAFKFNQQQLLEFGFIDIIIDNPNLFSFSWRIPYMIGSLDVKDINKLQQKIAEGGFGEVYVAKHLITNETHALKIIKQQEDQSVTLILQEAIIQDKIQKLNPQLFLNLKPLVYLQKNSYLVDIYIPLELGQFSLYEYIQKHQINDQEYNQFYNLFIDYIITLHSNKYAHRDIKPQNILYIKNAGWKLADFGESLQYDKVEKIYKIKGTFAFLPYNLRQKSKQNQQVRQNLLQNDLYAVVCTLIMIRNPNFNSKELTDYMDKNQLDQQLQQLLQNFDELEQLNKLKISQKQYIKTKIIIKQQIQDQECQWDWYFKLKFYIDQEQPLDNDFIQQLDDKLASFKQKQQQKNLIYLSILISLSFPFQIESFKNIIIFNFERHLLVDFQYLNLLNESEYNYTLINYFLNIKLYDFAIRICDQIISIEYEIIYHILKVNALIHLGKQKEAKEELELVYRSLLSSQSYSLQEQILFCSLYQQLHKEVPQIRVDKIFQNALINRQNIIKSQYHEINGELLGPINRQILNEQQHLKIRLDVIFDFIEQDPYNISLKECIKTVSYFGNHFIQDEQLQNCEQLIKLIKENLIFWSKHYIPKMHLIAIGLNYLLIHFSKYQAALGIGLYFHNILKNIRNWESILTHYEHLHNTQLEIFKLFNQPPFIQVDFHKCYQEVKNLSLFDQSFFNIQTMTIQYIQEISCKSTPIEQEEYNKLKLIRLELDQLKNIITQEQTSNSQHDKLRKFLPYMIINLLKSPFRQVLTILQIVKKIFKVLIQLNKDYRVFIPPFYSNLEITKQYKTNIMQLKQQIPFLIKNNLIRYMEKVFYNDLYVILTSPLKVLNIINMYGLNKKRCLFSSLEFNISNDVRHFIYCHQEFSKSRISTQIEQKIDKINLHYQYLNV